MTVRLAAGWVSLARGCPGDAAAAAKAVLRAAGCLSHPSPADAAGPSGHLLASAAHARVCVRARVEACCLMARAAVQPFNCLEGSCWGSDVKGWRGPESMALPSDHAAVSRQAEAGEAAHLAGGWSWAARALLERFPQLSGDAMCSVAMARAAVCAARLDWDGAVGCLGGEHEASWGGAVRGVGAAVAATAQLWLARSLVEASVRSERSQRTPEVKPPAPSGWWGVLVAETAGGGPGSSPAAAAADDEDTARRLAGVSQEAAAQALRRLELARRGFEAGGCPVEAAAALEGRAMLLAGCAEGLDASRSAARIRLLSMAKDASAAAEAMRSRVALAMASAAAHKAQGPDASAAVLPLVAVGR